MIIILLAKVGYLQIYNFGFYNTKSDNNRIEIIPIAPTRGIIYDRNNTPIAINKTIYQLNIIPDKVKNLTAQLDELKKLINLNDEDIENFKKERINYKSHRSVPLKNNLTNEEIAKFVVHQHLYPYVNITGTQHRYYPYGKTFTHVLGYVSKINNMDKENLTKQSKLSNYVGTSNIGKIGIERYYEDLLHGTAGYEEVEVNNRGRIIRQINHKPPISGEEIHLTLDLNLQKYIENLLGNKRAAVVALDPNNGEILALVSTPSYDPNLFVDGITNTQYKTLLENPDKPLFNRATLGTYPPASTVKPFVAIAALSENIITKNTIIYDPGYWQLPGTNKRYRDWLKWGHGNVDIYKSLEESVDTYYYQVAYDLGIDNLQKWMKAFGFGIRTEIDISSDEESTGLFPNREWKLNKFKIKWLPGDTIPVGIGQGYWTATPIQLAKALTILINNGKTYTPHLRKEIQSYEVDNNFMISKDIDKTYWDISKEGMTRVLFGKRGTARKVFENTKYSVAGKSGTAQVYGLKGGDIYDAEKIPEHLRDHALFIAYAPYDKPKIALAVVLENTGGGSTNGGAVAKKILDYYFLGDDSTIISEEILKLQQGD